MDNVTGELLGYVAELLLKNKALDVSITPIYMKKGRPGNLLTVLVKPDDCEIIENIIFEQLPTLGLRKLKIQRAILNRKETTVNSDEHGLLRAKKITEISGESYTKIEFEEKKRIADKIKIPLRKLDL